MGAAKRPKLWQGELASGSEYYFYRKPSTVHSKVKRSSRPKPKTKEPARKRTKTKKAKAA